MRRLAIERLFDRIGEINNSFLEEVYLIDVALAKARKRKKIAGGTTGVVVVTGVIVAYWRWKRSRIARSA
jgi:hypothetical protein